MKTKRNASTLPAPSSSDDDNFVTPGYAHPWDGESKVRELRVVRTKTGEVVHRVDVTGKSDHLVQKTMNGMLRNMADEFRVEDSEDDNG